MYEPVDEMVEKLLVPEMNKILDDAQIHYLFRASPPRKYVIDFPHGRATIYLNSFENWRRIVGGNYCFAGIDEIDTIQRNILDKSWNKINGRVRVGNKLQIFCTTTPEGFNFAYDFFGCPEVQHETDRKLYRLNTLDNPFIKDEYIENILKTYSPNLLKAYLYGEFCNLEKLPAYYAFDRVRNNSTETVQSGERLYIGQDFNVGKMASVVLVRRSETYHAVDEFFGLKNTPMTIAVIKEKYPNHRIELYPDASGASNHTSASQSDLQLFAQAGFQIVVGKTNPLIKERVLCTNTAFLNGNGKIHLFVNANTCRDLTRCLEQQAIGADGKPEKKNDLDHLPEAMDYVVFRVLPVTGRGGFGSSSVG